MPSEPTNQSGAENNLLVAIAGLTIAAGATAVLAAYIAGFVLDTMGNANSMALLLGADRIASDSADLERQLNAAQSALKAVKDLGIALGVGCLGLGVGVVVRYIRRAGRETAS